MFYWDSGRAEHWDRKPDAVFPTNTVLAASLPDRDERFLRHGATLELAVASWLTRLLYGHASPSGQELLFADVSGGEVAFAAVA